MSIARDDFSPLPDTKVHYLQSAIVGDEQEAPSWSNSPGETRAKLEAEREGQPRFDLAADTERMVAALRTRAYPSLEIECEVLPGEYHDTSPPLNLSRSVRYLFDAPR